MVDPLIFRRLSSTTSVRRSVEPTCLRCVSQLSPPPSTFHLYSPLGSRRLKSRQEPDSWKTGGQVDRRATRPSAESIDRDAVPSCKRQVHPRSPHSNDHRELILLLPLHQSPSASWPAFCNGSLRAWWDRNRR